MVKGVAASPLVVVVPRLPRNAAVEVEVVAVTAVVASVLPMTHLSPAVLPLSSPSLQLSVAASAVRRGACLAQATLCDVSPGRVWTWRDVAPFVTEGVRAVLHHFAPSSAMAPASVMQLRVFSALPGSYQVVCVRGVDGVCALTLLSLFSA